VFNYCFCETNSLFAKIRHLELKPDVIYCGTRTSVNRLFICLDHKYEISVGNMFAHKSAVTHL